MDFGNSITIALSFEDARQATLDEFSQEGFGLVSEINVTNTLKEKLDVAFRPYTILGMCNPPFAHQALSQKIDVGLLMPCNVVVYDNEDGTSTVSALKIRVMMEQFVPELDDLAAEIGGRIDAAIARLGRAHT